MEDTQLSVVSFANPIAQNFTQLSCKKVVLFFVFAFSATDSCKFIHLLVPDPLLYVADSGCAGRQGVGERQGRAGGS